MTLVIANSYWPIVKSHWPIALAMSFGSYVAGSTPMGGGTVGFPVLVLFFGMPGSLGRNFALAVQSIGMVSASIYILSSRQKLAWPILLPSLIGSLIGTPFGAYFVAPVVPDLWIKLLFGVVWASFGVLHLLKLKELMAAHSTVERFSQSRFVIGFAVGVIGGIVASITGVGIDMLVYAILILLYRVDLKVSVPSSVILMAVTSLVGIATNVTLARWYPDRFRVDPEVFYNWLAAAPIVALGAPLGAIVVRLIPRSPTLILVSMLCVGQFIWMLVEEKITGVNLLAAFAAVAFILILFLFLYRIGYAATSDGEESP